MSVINNQASDEQVLLSLYMMVPTDCEVQSHSGTTKVFLKTPAGWSREEKVSSTALTVLDVGGADGLVSDTISWIANRSFKRWRGLLIPISLWISVSDKADIIAPLFTLARQAATYQAGMPSQSCWEKGHIHPKHCFISPKKLIIKAPVILNKYGNTHKWVWIS